MSRALLVWLGCAVAAGAVALAIVLHGAPAEPRWGGGQAVVGGVYPGVQNLRLASSPDGHAVAVFEAGGRAYVSARAPGRRFTPPASISGSGVAAPPSVAVGVHGQALVAWAGRADPSAATTLQTAIRTDGVSAFQPLPVTAGSTPLDARAVFTPDGVPNVVWVQSRGGNRRVLASRLGATGTFDPPTELLAGHDVEVLDAKASPEGVWALAVADGALTAVMLTPGGKPVATRLDAAPDGGAALGAGTSGDVVAVWSSGGKVEIARHSQGIAFTPPVVIGAGVSPRATIDYDGDATLAWVGDAGILSLIDHHDGSLTPPGGPVQPLGACRDDGLTLSGDQQGSVQLAAHCPAVTVTTQDATELGWSAATQLPAGPDAVLAATAAGSAVAAWSGANRLQTAFRDLPGAGASSTLVNY